MNKKNIIMIIIITAIIITIIGIASISFNEEKTGYISDNQVVDMLGRTITVPENITHIASLSSSSTVQAYIFAPDKLVGWDSLRSPLQNKYMNREYVDLPYIGGGKQAANYENYISLKPNLVFVGHAYSIENVEPIQEKLGNIPLIDIEGDNNINTLTESIEFMGNILKNNETSTNLLNFYNENMKMVEDRVKDIPAQDKKKVYYAREESGLSSHPAESQHTQLIEICGGDNVVKTELTKGGVGISIERIIAWNPDVIIANDAQFYEKVYSDPLWKDIKAVKNKEVYLAPQSPFSWFAGPPGANTIIGIPWVAKVIYPEKFEDIDLKNMTKNFYSEFYHYNLTDNEVNDILSSSGLKEY
ncbi:MAG: ABC transporter substrate-binding protein [Methanobrevibacter sp.]|nr:ABC transporter substrate-binding protein [Methanobrevibacter sp.]